MHILLLTSSFIFSACIFKSAEHSAVQNGETPFEVEAQFISKSMRATTCELTQYSFDKKFNAGFDRAIEALKKIGNTDQQIEVASQNIKTLVNEIDEAKVKNDSIESQALICEMNGMIAAFQHFVLSTRDTQKTPCSITPEQLGSAGAYSYCQLSEFKALELVGVTTTQVPAQKCNESFEKSCRETFEASIQNYGSLCLANTLAKEIAIGTYCGN